MCRFPRSCKVGKGRGDELYVWVVICLCVFGEGEFFSVLKFSEAPGLGFGNEELLEVVPEVGWWGFCGRNMVACLMEP